MSEAGENNDGARVLECVAALEKMVQQLRYGCQQYYGNWAIEPSIALSELAKSAHQDFAEDVISMATLRFIVAVDYGYAVTELLRAGGQTVVAAFPIARAQMECAAAIIWLTEGGDAGERMNRYLSLRLDGLQQRLVTVEGSKIPAMAKDKVKADMDALLGKVKERGYSLISEKGKVLGVGKKMPGVTKLIDQTLGWGVAYRSFSAISHGERAAIVDAGILADTEKKLGEVKLKPDRAELVCTGVVAALTSAGLSLAQFLGWDRDALRDQVFLPAMEGIQPAKP